MPFTTPRSQAARERLRDHQSAATKVLATHSAALGRLEGAMSRRAEVVAAQDALVGAATKDVCTAVAAVTQVVGIDVAAEVLGLTKVEVRRTIRDAE